MQNLIIDNLSLILLLPLWIFLIIMCGRFFSVYVNKRIIYFLTLLSSSLGALACGMAFNNIDEAVEFSYPFIKINDFAINFGLQIDKLSLITAMLLFVISFAVQLFSIGYMKNEKKNYKYFAFLNLFNFSMAFLLFSPNLFQFYVFWELVGVVSYLLIGFDYKNNIKSDSSRRVFLINRIGDTSLIAGIILTSYYMYAYFENKAFSALAFEDMNTISTLLMAYTSAPEFYIICGLFILAAAVKSAQFPFYTWLQDAMEARLPVSALLHSATMVAAGVYLVMKMMPFFTLLSGLTNLITIIGILTALICSVLASVETHPKKVLAYSTSANLGLMFLALGLGYIKIALIFLIVHGFIKSALFLSLPDEKTKEIESGSFVLFCVNVLCLSGILLSGIAPKELIFNKINNSALSYMYLFVTFVTAYYVTRLAVLIYKNYKATRSNNILKTISFSILLCANIFLYFILRKYYTLAEPFVGAIGGLALAIFIWKNNALEKFHQTPKYIEKLYGNILPKIYLKFAQLLNNRIEKNVFLNYKPILYIAKCPVKITNWIEHNIMNTSVNIIKNTIRDISKCDIILQDGNVQTYNAYAFIIITAMALLVILCFWKLTQGM